MYRSLQASDPVTDKGIDFPNKYLDTCSLLVGVLGLRSHNICDSERWLCSDMSMGGATLASTDLYT